MTSGDDKYACDVMLEEFVFICVPDFDEAIAPRLKPRRVNISNEVVAVENYLSMNVLFVRVQI